MFSHLIRAVAVLVAVVSSTVSAIPKISVKGSKFFTENGDQFYIKGVAYQLVSTDPLLDTTQCKLDASLMKDLGANAIRVYHVDPNGDHSGCMSAFSDAGIYLFVDLDTFDTQIEENSPHWNSSQLDRFNQVLDEFVKYDNTAGVFVGNEVLTVGNQSIAAPYIKAAARDVKAHRDAKKYRNIPVGYSAADIASLRPMLQNYLACGTNASESLDFFSLNAYEWCGPSTFSVSGYSELVKNASNYNIPIFFSETGCNTNRPRDFKDQSAIFGPEMQNVWSGAIIYEWIQEQNDYGLVSYGAKVDPKTATDAPDGFPRSGTPTPVSPDFSNLKSQWATLTPAGVKSADYKPTNSAPSCPASTSGVWEVNAKDPLPSLGQTASKQTGSPTSTGSSTAASPSASKKPSSATGGREVAGMSAALVGVMLTFIWWL